MGKLVGLIILAVVLYQGWSVGRPWIEQRLDFERTDEFASKEQADSHRCIDLAQNATSTFGSTLRQFSQPPIDQREWTVYERRRIDVNRTQRSANCLRPGD